VLLQLTLFFTTHNVTPSPTENSPRTTAISHRELTRKRASVSSINPWSDTRETLQLLRHCWNAWRHCRRGHMTHLRSCIIQVFIAVAWQQMRRGDARLVTARQSSARLGSARRKHRFVYCCVIAGACSMLQFLHGVNTPHYDTIQTCRLPSYQVLEAFFLISYRWYNFRNRITWDMGWTGDVQFPIGASNFYSTLPYVFMVWC
jgi:hypothetical protein